MTAENHRWGESEAADQIWSLVCGYERQVRKEKPLAFLHAYFDDSSADSGDRRLFVAGYLANAPNWALFSEAWAECLRDEPSIEYLKMSEAKALREQFHGWSNEDRDAKLRRMSFIIKHFRPISFEFSVSRSEYFEQLSGVAPRGLARPHFSCAFGAIASVTRYLASEGIKTPVKFIFDEQDGVDADLNLAFDWMKRNLPRDARKLVSGSPSFESDLALLPLQAADMLAWHLRRNHEKGDCDPEMMARLTSDFAHVEMRLDASHLREWRKEFTKYPIINQLQSKGEWQRLRETITELKSAGYRFPHGSRRKNFVQAVKDRKRRLFRRLRSVWGRLR